MKNYHKRTNYLKLYKSWCRDLKETPVPEVDMLSDSQLIIEIDKLLVKHDCLPFTDKELVSVPKKIKQNTKYEYRK